jgi:hypothetical protein
MPECAIDNAGAVFSVVAVDIVVEMAFFMAGDGCSEHDNVIGLLFIKKSNANMIRSYVS